MIYTYVTKHRITKLFRQRLRWLSLARKVVRMVTVVMPVTLD